MLNSYQAHRQEHQRREQILAWMETEFTERLEDIKKEQASLQAAAGRFHPADRRGRHARHPSAQLRHRLRSRRHGQRDEQRRVRPAGGRNGAADQGHRGHPTPDARPGAPRPATQRRAGPAQPGQGPGVFLRSRHPQVAADLRLVRRVFPEDAARLTPSCGPRWKSCSSRSAPTASATDDTLFPMRPSPSLPRPRRCRCGCPVPPSTPRTPARAPRRRARSRRAGGILEVHTAGRGVPRGVAQHPVDQHARVRRRWRGARDGADRRHGQQRRGAVLFPGAGHAERGLTRRRVGARRFCRRCSNTSRTWPRRIRRSSRCGRRSSRTIPRPRTRTPSSTVSRTRPTSRNSNKASNRPGRTNKGASITSE